VNNHAKKLDYSSLPSLSEIVYHRPNGQHIGLPFSYNDDDIPQYVPEEDIYIAQPILVDNGNGVILIGFLGYLLCWRRRAKA
jgi:hypothetical protein